VIAVVRKSLALSAVAAASALLLAGAGCKKNRTSAPPADTSSAQLPQKFIGTWPATSNTAMAITGDITLGKDTLRLGDHVFVSGGAHAISASDVAALNTLHLVTTQPTDGFLEQVNIPASTPMLGGNSLCGNRDAKWLAGIITGDGQLGLAVFSGAAQPVLAPDALKDPHDLCGTYFYSKAQ